MSVQFTTVVMNQSAQRYVFRTSANNIYILYQDQSDFTNPTNYHMMKSSNNGSSWAEVDSAHKPQSASGNEHGWTGDIDANGLIHIAFGSSTSGAVGYITFNTSTDLWGTQAVAITLPAGVNANLAQAYLALDKNNIPHIGVSYSTLVSAVSTGYLTYSNRIGGSWSSGPTVNPNSAKQQIFGDFIIDTKDNIPVFISNQDDGAGNAGQLVVTYGNANNATSFTTSTIATGLMFTNARMSMVQDDLYNTWVGYFNKNTSFQALRKHNVGDAWGTWSSEISSGISGTSNGSINITAAGRNIYALYTKTSTGIAWTMYNGQFWQPEAVIEASSSNSNPIVRYSNRNQYSPATIDYSFRGSGGQYFGTQAGTTSMMAYFDASDAAATDPGATWTSDSEAFNGDFTTAATTTSTSSTSSGYLMAEGTNAPIVGGPISQVQARVYGKGSSDGSASYGSYSTLSTPSGGWTWQGINDLEVKIFSNAAASATPALVQATIYTNGLGASLGTATYTSASNAPQTMSAYRVELLVDYVPFATYTLSHGTSAVKKFIPTLTHSTDSFKRRTTTRTHTTSASKYKQVTKTHTTDANKRVSGFTKTHTTSSNKRVAGLTRSFTTDTLKRKANALTHSTDANKKLPNVTRTHSTDANKRKSGLFVTHTTDSFLRRQITKSHTTDALKRIQAVKTHTTDALRRKSGLTVAHTTDSFKRVFQFKSHTTSSNIRAPHTVLHSTSANKRVTGLVKTHTTDSNKRKSGLLKTHSTDAFLRKQNTRSHSTDANKRKSGVTKSHTTDTLTRKINTVVHSTSANKRTSGLLKSHTTDANKRKTFTKSHTADGFIQPSYGSLCTDYFDTTFVPVITTYTKTHSTDAVKSKRGTKSHTTDTLVRKSNVKTHSTDALKRKQIVVSHTTDTLKRKTNVKTHTTDTLLRKTNTKSHSTDSNKRKALTVSHTTDALKRGQYVRTHTTDANKRKSGFTKLHTTDALKRKQNLKTHTTDALKRKASVVTHTTDSFLRRFLTRSHTTDILKRKTNVVAHATDTNKRLANLVRTHLTDALKRKTNTRSHNTDSLKRQLPTISHKTDAFKYRRLVRTHSTDAFLRERVALSYSTDALKRKTNAVAHSADTLVSTAHGVHHSTSATIFSRRGTKKVLVGGVWYVGVAKVLIGGDWYIAQVKWFDGSDWQYANSE